VQDLLKSALKGCFPPVLPSPSSSPVREFYAWRTARCDPIPSQKLLTFSFFPRMRAINLLLAPLIDFSSQIAFRPWKLYASKQLVSPRQDSDAPPLGPSRSPHGLVTSFELPALFITPRRTDLPLLLFSYGSDATPKIVQPFLSLPRLFFFRGSYMGARSFLPHPSSCRSDFPLRSSNPPPFLAESFSSPPMSYGRISFPDGQNFFFPRLKCAGGLDSKRSL